MAQKTIGVAVQGTDSEAVIAGIKRAEELGIKAAWLTSGAGPGLDSLTLLAGAATQTRRIALGTAVVPTYPRHPIIMAQQTQVLTQLAPGRFRLGVGPSHRPTMVGTFGVDFRAPLGHLSEYLRVLKDLLQQGEVDFDGKYYKAHTRLSGPVDVPVMASALQPKSFDVCGSDSDGAISWVCPMTYLRDVALPAMKDGAQRAGKGVPPLIAHAPVCVHDNLEEVRAAIRERVTNPRMPFYQRMFVASGHPEASNGQWSDSMIDDVVLYGSESQVAEKLQGMFGQGADEVLASPIPAGANSQASLDRTLALLGQISRETG